LKNRVFDTTQSDGPRVVDLLLREEGVVLPCIAAIGAMAWRRTLYPCAWRDLEIPETALGGAFPPNVAFFIGFEGDTDSVAEPLHIAHGTDPSSRGLGRHKPFLRQPSAQASKNS
jgi:hypothetical protein